MDIDDNTPSEMKSIFDLVIIAQTESRKKRRRTYISYALLFSAFITFAYFSKQAINSLSDQYEIRIGYLNNQLRMAIDSLQDCKSSNELRPPIFLNDIIYDERQVDTIYYSLNCKPDKYKSILYDFKFKLINNFNEKIYINSIKFIPANTKVNIELPDEKFILPKNNIIIEAETYRYRWEDSDNYQIFILDLKYNNTSKVTVVKFTSKL